MLEMGQWATPVPVAASAFSSSSLKWMPWAYHTSGPVQPSQNAPTGYDILKLAPRGSARLLGRDDIGCLAAGMAADCFLISLDRIELAGAQFDPLSLLGTVGLKGPVDYTIVNGVAVVQNGELVTADEGELAARANAAVCRYLGRC